MTSLFEQFGMFLSENIFIAIFIALFAGIIASFTPCGVSSIPLIIGYVGGYKGEDKRKPLMYSLIFSLGLAITFTILGVLSATVGRIFIGLGNWLYIILGIIMLIVGLQMFDIIKIGGNSCKVPKKNKGLFGAFILGILGGVFATPCSTPVLIAILAFVAQKGNILLGGLLLLIYSIGHCALIMIAGTSVGFAQSISNSNKTNKISKILKYSLAVIVMLFGFYMIYIGV